MPKVVVAGDRSRIPSMLRRAVLAALLAAAPSPVGAHGGYTLEEDPCVAVAAGNRVHFSVYQPERNPTEEYCEDLPEVGSAILVVDLVDRPLRAQPIAFRVERPDGSVLLDLGERTYSTGVINAQATFPTAGRYAAVLTPHGAESARFSLDVATGLSPLVWSIPLVLASAPVLYWLARTGGSRRAPPKLTSVA